MARWPQMVKLADPERCPLCKKRGRVVNSRNISHLGYRRRRHKCVTCKVKWNSFQTLIDPKKLKERRKERVQTQPIVSQ